MSHKPPRRFSRISLATATILMLLIGVMVWPFLRMVTGVTDLPFATALPVYAGLLFLFFACGIALLFVVSVLEGHISVYWPRRDNNREE